MNLQRRKNKVKKEVEVWKEEKQLLLQEEQIKQQRREIKDKYKKERKKLTTTKLLMFFLFASCSAIEIFTIVFTAMTAKMGMIDFSAMQTLITAVVAEVIGFAVYSLKSLKQNTKGGIVYQTAMLQNSWKPIEEDQNNQEAVG